MSHSSCPAGYIDTTCHMPGLTDRRRNMRCWIILLLLRFLRNVLRAIGRINVTRYLIERRFIIHPRPDRIKSQNAPKTSSLFLSLSLSWLDGITSPLRSRELRRAIRRI